MAWSEKSGTREIILRQEELVIWWQVAADGVKCHLYRTTIIPFLCCVLLYYFSACWGFSPPKFRPHLRLLRPAPSTGTSRLLVITCPFTASTGGIAGVKKESLACSGIMASGTMPPPRLRQGPGAVRFKSVRFHRELQPAASTAEAAGFVISP